MVNRWINGLQARKQAHGRRGLRFAGQIGFSLLVMVLLPAGIAAGSYSHHFVVNDVNGTVYDKVTGQTWMKCQYGKSGSNCGGGEEGKNWQDSVNYCNDLNYGGRSDWVLPSVTTLKTIVNKLATTGPYTFTDEFPNTSNGLFWTSTDYSADFGGAWFVGFYGGVAYSPNEYYYAYHVRCVAPGP